jgi:multidrug efflux system membrane fusion protein
VTEGEKVEVLSGLKPGDHIVIDGADKLRDGAKVVIRSETNPNQTNSPAPTGPDKSGGGKRRRSENGQKQDGGQKQ